MNIKSLLRFQNVKGKLNTKTNLFFFESIGIVKLHREIHYRNLENSLEKV